MRSFFDSHNSQNSLEISQA